MDGINDYVNTTHLQDQKKRKIRFVDVVKSHLHNEIATEYTRTAFQNLQQVKSKHHPSMAVIKMEQRENGINESDTLSVKNAGNITMERFHQDINGAKTRHVMVVGHMGTGKSETAKKYAMAVSNGEIEELKGVELVHYIDASTLQVQEKSAAFDLLISQQIGEDLTPELQKEGIAWMSKNAAKCLFVIDGLDRTIEEFHGKTYGKINSMTRATPNAILANVFSGAIYKGIKILSTSRPRVYWKMDPKQKPQKVIAMRGFTDRSIGHIVKELAPNRSPDILQHLKNAPHLHSLCKNPMFLIYTTQVLSSTEETPSTESGILTAILKQYSTSGHSDADIDVLMKLAFHGVKENRFTFTARYVEKHGISMDELKGPISVGAVLGPNQEKAGKDDLQIHFAHQSLQEVLAAMYPFNFSREEFKQYVKYDLDKPGMDMALKMLCGIIWNPDTQKLARRFIQDRICDIEFWQRTLREYLIGRVRGGALKSGRVASAIYECGPKFLKEFAHHVRTIDLDWKECVYPHALLSVANYFAPLKEVYLRRIEVSSRLMPLLAESVSKVAKFKVLNLVICGETCPKCFTLLGKVIKKSVISSIEFDSCRLDVHKLQACYDEIHEDLRNILPNSYFRIRVLNDAGMRPECIEQLIRMIAQRDKSWITFVECQINDEKLSALHKALEATSQKLYYLELLEKDLVPARCDVASICNVLQYVEKQLQLGDWILNEINLMILRKSFNEYKNLSFGLVLTRNGRTASLKRGSKDFPDIFFEDTQKRHPDELVKEAANTCCTMCRDNDRPCCENGAMPSKIARTDNHEEGSSGSGKEILLEITATDYRKALAPNSSTKITVTGDSSPSTVNIQIFAQNVIKDNGTANIFVQPGNTNIDFIPP